MQVASTAPPGGLLVHTAKHLLPTVLPVQVPVPLLFKVQSRALEGLLGRPTHTLAALQDKKREAL